MTTRKRTPGGVPATTLAGNINGAVTSLTIADATGWPSTFPFDIIVNKASSTLRERITVGGRTTTTLNTLTRGIDGSTAQSHNLGDTVEVCVAGQYLDDLGQFLSVTTAGDLLYFDGTNWQRLVAGSLDQVIKQGTGPAAPAWSYKGIVPIYATTGARDAAIPSPTAGQGAYLDTGTSAEGLSFYNGSNWRLPWNMPWGFVGIATKTSAQTGITTVADVSSLTVTFTAVTGRRYKTSVVLPILAQNTNAATIAAFITDSTPTTIQQTNQTASAGSQLGITFFVTETISAASVTRKVRISSTASSLDVNCSATAPGVIVVEDIGPSGNPS